VAIVVGAADQSPQVETGAGATEAETGTGAGAGDDQSFHTDDTATGVGFVEVVQSLQT